MIALFRFTVRQLVWDRKVLLAVLLLGGPVVLALLLRIVPRHIQAQSPWEGYHGTLQYLLFMGVLPLVCMLYGPALLASEAENGTLAYLLTRRMRRASVLLVRFVAGTCVLSAMVIVALLVHHLVSVIGVPRATLLAANADWQPSRDLLSYTMTAPFAVTAYLAVFTAISLMFNRALLVSGLYIVVWELIIGNLPHAVRTFTISHHLRRTMLQAMPEIRRLSSFAEELVAPLYAPKGTGAIPLALVVAVLLTISVVVASRRELVPGGIARE